jgi:hypothetical protein
MQFCAAERENADRSVRIWQQKVVEHPWTRLDRPDPLRESQELILHTLHARRVNIVSRQLDD